MPAKGFSEIDMKRRGRRKAENTVRERVFSASSASLR